ncbi:MAG: AtpZ/AtpI family protein [Rhodospirillaceae bacterium]
MAMPFVPTKGSLSGSSGDLASEDGFPGLKNLEERLSQVRARRVSSEPVESSDAASDESAKKMLALAYRIGTEMVAALIIGVGGGIAIDSWLGTRPWGLIIMFFLGAGSAVSNIYRSINGIGYAIGYRKISGNDEKRQNGSEPSDGRGGGSES